jgi:hypothetical protein
MSPSRRLRKRRQAMSSPLCIQRARGDYLAHRPAVKTSPVPPPPVGRVGQSLAEPLVPNGNIVTYLQGWWRPRSVADALVGCRDGARHPPAELRHHIYVNEPLTGENGKGSTRRVGHGFRATGFHSNSASSPSATIGGQRPPLQPCTLPLFIPRSESRLRARRRTAFWLPSTFDVLPRSSPALPFRRRHTRLCRAPVRLQSSSFIPHTSYFPPPQSLIVTVADAFPLSTT